MTNQEILLTISAMSASQIVAVKWLIGKVIDYTHLQRDVKELQKDNEKHKQDLKGLGIKLNQQIK